jgi:Ca-activated chloride channel family protein
LEALKLAQEDRRLNVIFLTDGLPTVGETDASKIIANFRAANTKGARVFAFGVGYDVNTVLLDTVSQESGGFTQYVKPGESVNERVAAFYTKIQSPVLTQLTLDFGGARVEDFYPRTLPDLYRGGQLVLVGRYREPAQEVVVTLKGRVDGEERVFTYPDQRLPAEERGNAFLPRLWATRKVGYLLNQIRLYGANPEVVQEVVELSKHYGIITPYTSFLVQEPQAAQPPRGTPSPGVPVPVPTVVPMPFATPMPSTGAGAVQQAEAFGKIATADVAAPSAPSEAPQLRAVGSKTFLLKGEVWTDTAYTSGAETHKVALGSSAYFDLLSRYPEAGAYLALGQRVILVLEGTTYEVVPAGDAGETPTPTPTLETRPKPIPETSPTPTPASTGAPQPTGGFGCARGSRPAATDAAGLLALAGMVALVLRPSRGGLRRRR